MAKKNQTANAQNSRIFLPITHEGPKARRKLTQVPHLLDVPRLSDGLSECADVFGRFRFGNGYGSLRG